MTMVERFNFTKKRIDALPLPEKGKRAYHHDARVNGLVLQITGAGTRTFQVYKKFNGKPMRVTLGRYPGMTIEQARKLAQIKLAELAGGINPNQKKRAERAAGITLGEVFEDYLKARKSLKPGTVFDYRRVMLETFPDWQAKPLKDITRDMVERRHQQRGETSQARANGAMRVLRALFNFAQGQYENEFGEILFPDNPVRRISHTRAWYQVDRRRTLIKMHELEPWFKAVLSLTKSDGPQAETARDYLLLLLFTGLRLSETAELKWKDVDFKAKTITLYDTKNREPLPLPVSDYIYEMLARRRNLDSNGIFVFGSPGTKSGHLENPSKPIKKVRERSGIYFTPHDLRRTFTTITESLDISAYAIKRLINHKMSGDVTAGYIVHNVERLREPVQTISDVILKAAGIKPTAEIIDIRGKAKAE